MPGKVSGRTRGCATLLTGAAGALACGRSHLLSWATRPSGAPTVLTERFESMHFVPAGFFVLRTPLLPYDVWASWVGGVSASEMGGDEEALARALRRDRDRTRSAIRDLVTQGDVREALFLGSPDLEAGIDSWLEAPETRPGQRIERALLRYLTRMTTRPTPFGLLAGVTVGTVGERTRVYLVAREGYRRHTQLDGAYLEALVQALARDPGLRADLRYRPNTSIYPAAGRVRYVEIRRDGDDSHAAAHGRRGERPDSGEWWRSYSLADVADTPYLRATLSRAAGGATARALAEALASDDDGITVEDAARYVQELIDNQILLPDLPLPVTGAEPVATLEAALRVHPAGSSGAVVADRLAAVRKELATLDAAGLGAELARYRAVTDALLGLSAPVERRHLFRVDLFKPATEAVLGRSVAAEIARGVELLHRLSRAPLDPLARFRERFRERYEERVVPLPEVLDEENGIGFEGGEVEPLLRTLDLGAAPAHAHEVPWGEREALLLTKLAEALAAGAHEIALEQSDIDELAAAVLPGPRPLPRALAAVATVAAASPEAIDRGEFRVYLAGAQGPSGAQLLGRFCNGDEELCRRVVEHLRAEEALDPDAVYAEVVHSPAGRVDNILGRPILREREIVYLGDSGAPRERRIAITDLLVSVEAGRVVLRNVDDGRRVVPRLTSAHNHALRYNLSTYRFLCALQAEGTSGGARWDWGPLASSPFLPRVRAGRLVLALARWRVPRDEVRPLASLHGAARLEAVRRWRARRDLPRHIAVADYDNVLPLDLESALGIETFVHLAKEREGGVTLEEEFPDPDELWVRGPEGRFTHELIVPFVTPSELPAPGTAEAPQRLTIRPAPPAIARTFAPGSEWLYAKLYGGTATADRVLRHLVGPLVRRARAEGWTDRWFFIRYADPEPHLRVRFHGVPGVLRDSVLAALHQGAAPLLADGSLWRLQLDTYEREVERYGGDETIELVEALFEAESDAVLDVVERAAALARDDRWQVALCGIDMLLSDLGFDAAARRAIVTRAGESYRSDYRIGPKLGRQLGERFRGERRKLEALLTGDASSSPPAVRLALDALRRRSDRLAPIAEELRARDAAGRLTTPLAEVAPSLTHMFAIRLLRADARVQEVVLYDFLARLYDARAAREKERKAAAEGPPGDRPPHRATIGVSE